MPIHLPPVSRRNFLRSILATGIGTAVPRQIFAAAEQHDPDRFLLLADTHIPMDPHERRHGVNPVETFTEVVRQIIALPHRHSQAIFCGDCACLNGLPGDYAMLSTLIKPLRTAGMTLHFALGNHDHRENFLSVFPEAKATAQPDLLTNKYVSIIETPLANWFLLDSLDLSKGTHGALGEKQIKWLADALDARPHKPALLVAHHNLNPFFTNKNLLDTQRLLDVISRRRQVQAYFFGHTHAWSIGRYADIYLVNIPTTAWTFGASENQPRGFVTVRLRNDGATVKLHSLDQTHKNHGETVTLAWR